MLSVVQNFSRNYNIWLLLLAALVCGVAALATFNLYSRAVANRGRSSAVVWLILTTLTAGSGIWATHFTAMMAFHPGFEIGFDLTITILSFVVGIVGAGLAFMLAFQLPGRVGQGAGGIVLGLAVVLMHYTGVSGMEAAAAMVWNRTIVALSVVLAIGPSVAALMVCGRCGTLVQRLSGGLLFGLSIILLHFSGMAAIAYLPDPTKRLPDHLLSGNLLGYSVAGVTLIIVGSALAAWSVERRVRWDSEIRFRYLARHDPLTGLPNRLLFEEVVRRELTSAALGQRSVAMLCLDLDGFKEINDIFGHAAGDRLLTEVARRLQCLPGEQCTAARLGGDEFAVLASGLGATRTASGVAQSVLDALGAPYVLDGNKIDVGCSIGIALFPSDAQSYAMMLAQADTALSRAKSDGRGIFRYFEPAMDQAMRERRQLGRDLRAALNTSQLRLEYQPQLSLGPDQVSGFEALLRWDHPALGSVSPSTFIPIAEETGLILPLGEWVLREACRQAANWAVPLRIAVNLSVAQFRQTGLTETIKQVLDDMELSPDRLELEITESLFFESIPRALQVLERIKALGVRIAIDDFGTGYSSLSTLQAFPFNTIKIDRSFTAQIGSAPKGTAIVKAILGLGDSLGMEVVAEGVETQEQLAFLRRHGCSQVQGYLCGKPLPIERYADVVSRPQSAKTSDKVVPLRVA